MGIRIQVPDSQEDNLPGEAVGSLPGRNILSCKALAALGASQGQRGHSGHLSEPGVLSYHTGLTGVPVGSCVTQGCSPWRSAWCRVHPAVPEGSRQPGGARRCRARDGGQGGACDSFRNTPFLERHRARVLAHLWLMHFSDRSQQPLSLSSGEL